MVGSAGMSSTYQDCIIKAHQGHLGGSATNGGTAHAGGNGEAAEWHAADNGEA